MSARIFLSSGHGHRGLAREDTRARAHTHSRSGSRNRRRRKWKKATNPDGVPVWSRGGIICTGETYRNAVKLTFMKGAALKAPRRLFNASLEGNASSGGVELHAMRINPNFVRTLAYITRRT